MRRMADQPCGGLGLLSYLSSVMRDPLALCDRIKIGIHMREYSGRTIRKGG